MAVKAGLFHPNCRHTLTTWIEGISERPEPLNKAEVERVAKLEKRQRELERRVRQYKQLAAGTLDEEAAKHYRTKACEAQKALREFVAQHGDALRRDGWREREDGFSNPARRATMEAPDEMQRRRIGSQRQEIIDKPTYNKLTRDFLRRGGIIIRGEDAERHLKLQGAYASYITGGNIAFIRDDATVSDVLEEMFHAEQDRVGRFGRELTWEGTIRREIEAQEYLLSCIEKYKIPQTEAAVTRTNLNFYLRELEKILEKKGQG